LTHKHIKVLIIDDSAADRRIYRRFLQGLQQYELEIFEEASAQQGLERCIEVIPDIVIMDYRLPDLDGLSLLESVQAKMRVPVIFITGKPEALLVSEAYRRGAVKYISKDTITSASIQEALVDALELTTGIRWK
jgi:Response regulator containing a CheY-like receiver domain and an HTH DNA-binding domain